MYHRVRLFIIVCLLVFFLHNWIGFYSLNIAARWNNTECDISCMNFHLSLFYLVNVSALNSQKCMLVDCFLLITENSNDVHWLFQILGVGNFLSNEQIDFCQTSIFFYCVIFKIKCLIYLFCLRKQQKIHYFYIVLRKQIIEIFAR